MTKDKALKIALEALENAEYSDYGNKELNKAITAIKKALAQPEYNTTPPQRTWVGLTDEELTEIRLKTFDSVATNIEAKLKDKNT